MAVYSGRFQRLVAAVTGAHGTGTRYGHPAPGLPMLMIVLLGGTA